jgi:hypothetical protein
MRLNPAPGNGVQTNPDEPKRTIQAQTFEKLPERKLRVLSVRLSRQRCAFSAGTIVWIWDKG